MHPLTIIVTSCDRFDLLEKTLDSFFALNTYPYVAFHIHNDSLKLVSKSIKDKYQEKGITWHEGTKRGLSASWDYLVNLVETEYFFNIEDDWKFEGNPNFIRHSIGIMDLFKWVDQVWIRDKKDHNHPIEVSELSIMFEYVLENGDWCGFTFNPSVRKLSKWHEWFPFGIAGKDEIELSRELKGKYNAVSLNYPSIRHIGGGRHSKGFKI